MELLKNRILKDGRVYPDKVLKVDGFLNHQVDVRLLEEIAKEFHRLFADGKVNKILTIEASGIGIAAFVAKEFDCPMLFAKKTQTKNIASTVYTERVMSYTHGKVYDIIVSKEYLKSDDRVLIIDDFLANGAALRGLIGLVKQAGATLIGCGAVIEKAFQPGGEELRKEGIRVEALARIASMTDDSLTFVED